MHINWNWARWEWMFFHPEFDRDSIEKIGLWLSEDSELVGVAIYDHYFGEAFFAVKPGHEELEKSIIDYMTENLSDESGLGIAVNDEDIRLKELLTAYGFTENEQSENVLELSLEGYDLSVKDNIEVTLREIDINSDLYKHHALLWKGFDHQGEAPSDEDTIAKQREMLSATHLDARLHIVAQDKMGELISYCGLWYLPHTDYVYVEPVCTIPQHRGKGIAKQVIKEALKNAYAMGAKRAYVISDMGFYKQLGFRQHSHYTFYWVKK